MTQNYDDSSMRQQNLRPHGPKRESESSSWSSDHYSNSRLAKDIDINKFLGI